MWGRHVNGREGAADGGEGGGGRPVEKRQDMAGGREKATAGLAYGFDAGEI
jgi:hypothetical protein